MKLPRLGRDNAWKWLGGGVAVFCLVAPFLLRPTLSFYSDGAGLREAVKSARPSLREVLWQPARSLGATVNRPETDEYEPTVSPDGRYLAFTRGRPGGRADLWIAERRGSAWAVPRPIDAVNSAFDDMGASLAVEAPGSTRLVLYFYSDRPGGFGDYDLWLSRGDSDGGGFGVPRNLGPQVNGPFAEINPSSAADPGVLLFATNRRDGAPPGPPQWSATVRATLDTAGFDIFGARRLAGSEVEYGEALLVEALSLPASTEGALSFAPQGDFVYFSSDRSGGQGGFDLYRSRFAQGLIGPPENLGSRVNTPGHELDPAVGLGGFELYFARRPLAGDSEDIFVTTSREVFLAQEAGEPYWQVASVLRFWRDVLSRTDPTIVALISSLFIALVFAAFFGRRMTRLALLTRCFVMAFFAHLLVAVWMNSSKVHRVLMGTLGEAGGLVDVEVMEVISGGAPEGDVAVAIRGTTAETGGDASPQMASGGLVSPEIFAPRLAALGPQALDLSATDAALLAPGRAHVEAMISPASPVATTPPEPGVRPAIEAPPLEATLAQVDSTDPGFAVTARPLAAPEAAPAPLEAAAFAARAELELPGQEATGRIEVALRAELAPEDSDFRAEIHSPETPEPPALPAREASAEALGAVLLPPSASVLASSIAEGRALAGPELPRARSEPSLAARVARTGSVVELAGARSSALTLAQDRAPPGATPTASAAVPSREMVPSPDETQATLPPDREDSAVLAAAPSARALTREAVPSPRSRSLAVELSSNALTGVAPDPQVSSALEQPARTQVEAGPEANFEAPNRLVSREESDRPGSLPSELGSTLATETGSPDPAQRSQAPEAAPSRVSARAPQLAGARLRTDLSAGVARAEELELQNAQAKPLASLTPAIVPPRSREEGARPADAAVVPGGLAPPAQPLAFDLQARQGNAEAVRRPVSVALAVARSSEPSGEETLVPSKDSGLALAPLAPGQREGLPPGEGARPPLAVPATGERLPGAQGEPEITLVTPARDATVAIALPELGARGATLPGTMLGEAKPRAPAQESLRIEATRAQSAASAAPNLEPALQLVTSRAQALVTPPSPPTGARLPAPLKTADATEEIPLRTLLPGRAGALPDHQVTARSVATSEVASSPAARTTGTSLLVARSTPSPLPAPAVERETVLLPAGASDRPGVSTADTPPGLHQPELRLEIPRELVEAAPGPGGAALPLLREMEAPRSIGAVSTSMPAPTGAQVAAAPAAPTAAPAAAAADPSSLPALSLDRSALAAASETRALSRAPVVSVRERTPRPAAAAIALSPSRPPPGPSIAGSVATAENIPAATLRAPDAPAPDLKGADLPLASTGARVSPTVQKTPELEVKAPGLAALSARHVALPVPLPVGRPAVPGDRVASATGAPLTTLPALGPGSVLPSPARSLGAPADDAPRASLPPRESQLALEKGPRELRREEIPRAPRPLGAVAVKGMSPKLPASERRSLPGAVSSPDISPAAAPAPRETSTLLAGAPKRGLVGLPGTKGLGSALVERPAAGALAAILPPRRGDLEAHPTPGATEPLSARVAPEPVARPRERVRLSPVRAVIRASDEVNPVGVAAVARADGALVPSVSLALAVPNARAMPASAQEPGSLASGSLKPVQAQSSFVPKIYQLRARSRREDAVRLGGGSEETEKAVALGLKWLAIHQSPDGRWDLGDYMDHLPRPSERDRWHPDWDGRGRNDSRGGASRADSGATAATALALLAYLGHGDTQFESGPYQANVQRGLKYLLKAQKRDGDLRGGGNLYMHAIASFALCEAYALTRDPVLEEPARRAIGYALRTQNPDLGGWRYEPYPQGRDVDTSVFGWMLMAVKSAHLAQIEVEPRALTRMAKYLESARMSKNGGRFAYQPGLPRSSLAMTAQGLFSQQILSELKPPSTDEERLRLRRATNEAVSYLISNRPERRDQDGCNSYYWYYATLALFQEEGVAWETWNSRLKEVLLGMQVGEEHGTAAGSWDPLDRRAQLGGRVYATAISILCLEVYYRYAPREKK